MTSRGLRTGGRRAAPPARGWDRLLGLMKLHLLPTDLRRLRIHPGTLHLAANAANLWQQEATVASVLLALPPPDLRTDIAAFYEQVGEQGASVGSELEPWLLVWLLQSSCGDATKISKIFSSSSSFSPDPCFSGACAGTTACMFTGAVGNSSQAKPEVS